LVQRLTIAGFLMFVKVPTMRLMYAVFVTILYMVLLLLLQPFKRVDLNVLSSVAVQFSLVMIYLGGLYMLQFDAWRHWSSSLSRRTDLATEILGVSSTNSIVNGMIFFNFAVLCLFLAVTVWQALVLDQNPSSLRLEGPGNVPDLGVGRGIKFHLFLSHIWSSGQDQVANIKRQLMLLLPGVDVFLDVDNLDSIDNLEKHIDASQVHTQSKLGLAALY
jgi:hypothetical protein